LPVKRLIPVLALIGSLLFAASASAHDVNNDRIPDRWEKRHGLSLQVKQTHRDQDEDGFKNRAEWRAKTDPRDADSDDDGIDDADENAGKVSAFANGELAIELFDGGTLTGMVTADTDIECDADSAKASHDPGDDDEGDDDDRRGDRDEDGDDDHGDHRGDRDDDHGDHRGDHRGDRDEDCGAGPLTVGRGVEEAELKITSKGRFWKEIELR
jgi:hypothetical protein